MGLPAFTKTLHFRISGLFLLLLAGMAGGFWFWFNEAILDVDLAAEEADYFENRAETELDSLALELTRFVLEPEELERRLVDYGAEVDRFNVELMVFHPTGRQLGSSAPDSLGEALPLVSQDLLHQMSLPDWDYSTYPDETNLDAYVNRIFEVDRIVAPGASDNTAAAYLVASLRPYIIGLEELEGNQRALTYQSVVLLLVYAAICGLVIMFWLTRRLGALTRHVEKFAEGDLSRRSGDRSKDEIGRLGQRFNHMAERIEEMVDKLQLKEQFQRQLIANISHDLRTPMASMRGYAETLSMQADKLAAEDRERYLAIITANLDHLDKLIDHMLTLSRFESGQTVFQMEEFSLAELADSVIMRCEPLASERQVELLLECAEDCPALVKADPMQIAQVLQNLLENGIKFNNPGGRVILRISSFSARKVQLAVSDTGVGIAQEDLPHIFDRFYTGDKSRSRTVSPGMHSVQEHLGQSSGLGLAIAAKIVAGHNSEMQVSSELGKGTTFRFTLPAATASEAMEGQGS
jgi:signal transduction histidine kinase